MGTADHALRDEPEQQPLVAVIVAAALIVAIALYVVLRAGPNVIGFVGPWLAALPTGSSPNNWIAPAVAVGAVLAGGSIAAVALAAFVRGVRQDPFRWLAPVLIAFSSVVMTRLGLERSMGPLPASLFGALTALLLLGGGVLVQAQGMVGAVSGGVLLTLPVLGLVLDQAHSAHGIEQLLLVRDPDALLSMLVLAMTSVGVGLTAFVGRPAGSLARAVARGREWDRHRDQLGQALERARISELRQSAAEARAQELEQLINDHCEGMEADADEFAVAAKPKWQKPFIAFGLIVIGASAGAVGLHAAMVSPLQAQLATERNAATAALAKREGSVGDAVASARTQLEADRTRLQSELTAQQQRAEAAIAEAKTAQEKLAALTAPAAPAPEAAPVKEAKPRATQRAKRVARKSSEKAAPSAADGTGLREAVSDDPIGGL